MGRHRLYAKLPGKPRKTQKGWAAGVRESDGAGRNFGRAERGEGFLTL